VYRLSLRQEGWQPPMLLRSNIPTLEALAATMARLLPWQAVSGR
jgi:hypothetical protein